MVARWSNGGIHTLVVVKRQTVTLATQKKTCETAYYLSHQGIAIDLQGQA